MADISREIQTILIHWAFKGGKYLTGWGTFEHSLYALVTLVLTTSDEQGFQSFKQELEKRLSQPAAPSQEIRNDAARGMREKAESWYPSEFDIDLIEYHMGQLDQTKLKSALIDVANLISPESADAPGTNM